MDLGETTREEGRAAQRQVSKWCGCYVSDCVDDGGEGVHETASAGKDRVGDPVRPRVLFVCACIRAGARARAQPPTALYRTNGVRVRGATLFRTGVQTGQEKGPPRRRTTASAFWPSSVVDNDQCRRFWLEAAFFRYLKNGHF
ncbi:hypothetical protein [Pandoravirus japonicus]|uniref:Uncharacterized protein n=1 Tax=Pandoravirus japonicus TaxID=2823154 RepID=A0A811BRU9_9VIRU|nr:hypothetical protein [Pandoravirus japonicus]